MLTAHPHGAHSSCSGVTLAPVGALGRDRLLPRRNASPVARALLTLAQTVLVAQVGLGLLLLSDDHRARAQLHYAYGTFALLAVLAPWFYAPKEPRKRLAWFSGATLVAAALAVRAYMTA